MAVDWRLLPDPGAPANGALRAFEQGVALGDHLRQRKEETEFRRAVADYQRDPSNRDALNAMMQLDPQTAIRLRDDADKREFRGALSDYVGRNALAATPAGPAPALSGFTGQGPQRGALSPPNALLGAADGRTGDFSTAFAPFAEGAAQPAPAPEPAAAESADAQAPDLSFLGAPQSREDAAFLRMLRVDPMEALKVQSEMRETFRKRLEDEREFYSIAVDELSRMQDDNGWQQALVRLRPIAEALGADLSTVPTSYPGPEAVDELLTQSLPVKERLDLLLREADLIADNERADRNTDSLVEDRAGRRAEQRRANQARVEATRRGQDISSRDRIRGQDITDARGRRSQDVTDARGRGTPPPANDLPLVSSPEAARSLPKGTRFRTPDGRIMER